MAGHCASSCRIFISGRAPSGFRVSNSRAWTSRVIGKSTAITIAPIPGPSSAIPTIRKWCVPGSLKRDVFTSPFSAEPGPKQVQNWLKRHKRFNLHFIPTSSSWLNLVERFFALITQVAIRRGVFKSVADLEAAIADYLAKHNATSKPFVWTKSADVILRKVERALATLTAVKYGNQALESEH